MLLPDQDVQVMDASSFSAEDSRASFARTASIANSVSWPIPFAIKASKPLRLSGPSALAKALCK